MEKVKLISDGTALGTKVFKVGEDGEEESIPMIGALNYSLSAGDTGKLTLNVIFPIIEVECNCEYQFDRNIINKLNKEQLIQLNNLLMNEIKLRS